MSRIERLPVIAEIERLRSSKVICYLTSTRQNSSAQMAEDAVRVFFDHLLAFPKRPIDKIDIYLCSNGGNNLYLSYGDLICLFVQPEDLQDVSIFDGVLTPGSRTMPAHVDRLRFFYP